MATVSIEVRGLERANALLDKLRADLFKHDLLTGLGGLVEGQTKRRIAFEKADPDGVAWPALKPSTVKQKGNDNILVDTGRLLGSINHTVSGDQAVVGTNVFYGGFHQGGSRKSERRAFMGVSATNMSEIETTVIGFVERYLG